MKKEEKLILLKNRYNVLATKEKNIKSGGVLRKLRRKIFKLESSF